MGAHSKTWVIRRRRARKEKMARLRKRYTESTTEAERSKVLDKLKKLSPFLSVEEFLRTASAPKPEKAKSTKPR